MYPQHFLSSHFVSVLSAHPVCWFWEQAVWMVQGQKASNAISPRTDVFFLTFLGGDEAAGNDSMYE